jgi:hypothetical protein
MTVVVLDSAPHWNESLYPEKRMKKYIIMQHPFQILVQLPKESAHSWTTYWQSSQLINEISNEYNK